MTQQAPDYEFKSFDDFLAAPVDWDIRGNPIPRAATLHGSWAAAARYGFEAARKVKGHDSQVLRHSGAVFTSVAGSYQGPTPSGQGDEVPRP